MADITAAFTKTLQNGAEPDQTQEVQPDPEAPSKGIKNDLDAMRNFRDAFPRDEDDTDQSDAFFLEGVDALFGPKGDFRFVLDMDPHEITDDLERLTMDDVHQWFHEQVKLFLRANDITPPSEAQNDK